MNSEHILFNNIIKFSLFNMSTTIGEIIKDFMYKYNITMSDWGYRSHSICDGVCRNGPAGFHGL